MYELLLRLSDPVPADNAVKAGWTAFAVFLFLMVAVALLGWSLSRQLKKVAAAKAAGRFDEPDKKN
jgi:cbb3-type cytochrome oxidase subunit 3